MAAPQRLERLERTLRSRLLRLALAALVVLSLVPLGDLGETLRPVFLIVFGAELVARFVAWRARGEAQSAATTAFAAADVLAFISFLPIEQLLGEEQAIWLALLRLSRLLMLLRFARDLAIDIYAILTRREQLHQLALVTGAVLFLSFVSAVILSQLAILPDTEHRNFGDQLWWSFRQMESADNLVPSLRANPVLVALSLGLTITGVFVISFIIGIGTTIVEQVVRTERLRALSYREHTVIAGPIHQSEVLIREFVRIYAKNRQIPSPERLLTWLRYARPWESTKSLPKVALLGRADEPPDYIYEPIMRWVVYREGDAAEASALARIAARDAKRAILLARHELLHEADAVTIATLAAFRAQNQSAHAFVEVTESATVPIAEQVGGPGTFALDVPRVLGMFLCQHLITPGVERLYRDLLTADGSEIYTHVYVDDPEKQALRGRVGLVPFSALQRLAHDRGIYLIGVLLGEREVSRNAHGVVEMTGLVPWLNPLVLPDDNPRVAALGARPGEVPIEKLRGIIGITESYLPLKALGEQIAFATPTEAPPAPGDGAVEALARACTVLPPTPRRVVMIGASDALPSLLRELSRYVPGVDVTLFMSERGDELTPLPRRLENLGVGFQSHDPLPGAAGRAVALERGGALRVYTHEGPDLTGFAVSVLRERSADKPVDAAVFLCEPEGDERDARTALRILRFTRLLEEGAMPHGDALHVLAEFQSVDKGAHIQRHVDGRKCGFADTSALKLTLVSTDTIKNYFMVHSAFVPGVNAIYDELLQERGQEIVWLRFAAPDGVMETTMRAFTAALAERRAVAVALELADGSVRLAPPPDAPVRTSEVRGVYVVVDQPHLGTGARGGPAPERGGDPGG